MKEVINDGGPAFPESFVYDRDRGAAGEYVSSVDAGCEPGMTLREYAAIKLKVPDSGADWLDDMIRESLENDLSAKAMQAIIEKLDLKQTMKYEDGSSDGKVTSLKDEWKTNKAVAAGASNYAKAMLTKRRR